MTMSSDTSVRTVVYPSPELPATPAFELNVPPDWEVGQAPGLLLAAGPATWDGPFRTNVTISAGLASRDTSLQDLARAYVAELAEGSYQVESLEDVDASV